MTSHLMVALMIASLAITAADMESEDDVVVDPQAISCELSIMPAYSMPGAILELPQAEDYVVIEEPQYEVSGVQEQHLTKQSGVFSGPSGKETYYNLNMSGVVKVMRGMGYTESEYPYWEREDGAKMLGPYVMVAADFDIRPRGTLVETSLGTGLVCDTGGFASGGTTTMLDIAVNW